MRTLSLNFIASDGGGDSLTGVLSNTADALEKIDVPLDTILTAEEVTLPVTLANLRGLVITSPIAATINTNDNDTPDDPIGLTAGGMFAGLLGTTMPINLTADLVKVFITTAVASAGNKLIMWVLKDVTP